MIPRVNERSHTPHDPLSAALGRPLSAEEVLTEHTVVAHWQGLYYFTLDGDQTMWTAAQWAEHLEDPLVQYRDGRRAIFHLDARLHPDDRDLSDAEWAEVAYRLARAASIETPGDKNGCAWIAVQGQRGRIDLIASLIRYDGTWQKQPADHLRRLQEEARRIEQDLHLTPVRAAAEQRIVSRPVPTASAQLATVLAQLADEQSGPLATVRGLVEHTAHRIAQHPGAAGPDLAHRLELIARRLHGIQHDLNTTAAALVTAPRPRVAATAQPAVHAPARRSP